MDGCMHDGVFRRIPEFDLLMFPVLCLLLILLLVAITTVLMMMTSTCLRLGGCLFLSSPIPSI